MSSVDMVSGGNGADVTVPPFAGADDANEPALPTVLTINAERAQRFLQSNDPVLNALFGTAFRRFDFVIPDICITSSRQLNKSDIFCLTDENILTELKLNPKWSYDRVLESLASDTHIWLLRTRLIADLQHAGIPGNASDVKVILVDQQLLQTGSILSHVINERLFPNATVFSVNVKDRSELPVPFETPSLPPGVIAPMCSTCHKKMRPAGEDAFVCESCGTTRLTDMDDLLD